MNDNPTPGPWIVGDDEDSDLYLVGPHDGDGIVYHPVVSLHNEANASLIASAPELLDACKFALGALIIIEEKLPELWELNCKTVNLGKIANVLGEALIKAVGEQK